jgi:hypothetical protein
MPAFSEGDVSIFFARPEGVCTIFPLHSYTIRVDQALLSLYAPKFCKHFVAQNQNSGPKIPFNFQSVPAKTRKTTVNPSIRKSEWIAKNS